MCSCFGFCNVLLHVQLVSDESLICAISRGREVGSTKKYLREPAEPSYFILGKGAGTHGACSQWPMLSPAWRVTENWDVLTVVLTSETCSRSHGLKLRTVPPEEPKLSLA